ncbi:hypothetical protein RND71_025950 [Anisodus tanguticus]|uniref:NB-ARC domain-containing protein n=1 Tax=Anisodus tanguticus TaxID=243964 RepID=A0AAE1V7W0_9SOLA|nr:hypothetical protein RND71_025950 [Anisodus tanguticus]
MQGLGKTTLAYRLYNDKSVVDHFDILAWCTVDHERNEKKLLQKIFNQVIGLKERFSEDDIDDDVADKLWKQLFGKRYLIVLDDLWDTATWDELTRPFPEFQKISRESCELLEKRVFGEEHCPHELKDVGEKIARKCNGLPFVLDLIGGVISRKEKKKALWLEVLNNLKSFIFKDDEEVMKVTQLSYDHLSDHLKQCLLYLASYPKDEDIVISELKDLWSAEGLVGQTEMEVYVDERSRKEKLFDLTSSSAPSLSSSDLMPRAMTVHYDRHFPHSAGNFVLFNAEKENPYVKHLLSLKVYMDDNVGHMMHYNCHLRHLRLLKRLELPDIMTDSLLNEIGMLVHLKFLNIQTEAKALPPSFSNLCNVETLVVQNQEGSCMKTQGIFERFPNLQTLRFVIKQLPDCSAEKICFPRLDVLNELEEPRVYVSCDSFSDYTHGFPSSLKKLELKGLALTSDSLSRIARLPNLQKLRLAYTIIWGVIANESFPVLEALQILDCTELMEIPDSFGDIASLSLSQCGEALSLKSRPSRLRNMLKK